MITMVFYAWKTSDMKEQKRHKFVGLRLKLLKIMCSVVELDAVGGEAAKCRVFIGGNLSDKVSLDHTVEECLTNYVEYKW